MTSGSNSCRWTSSTPSMGSGSCLWTGKFRLGRWKEGGGGWNPAWSDPMQDSDAGCNFANSAQLRICSVLSSIRTNSSGIGIAPWNALLCALQLSVPSVFSSHCLFGDSIVCRFEWIQGRWWNGLGDWNWPFVVHFVGCKPCGGKYASYDRDACIRGMKR